MNGIHEVTGSIPVWSTILRPSKVARDRTRAREGFGWPINLRTRSQKMASTKDVLEHHVKCFGESDVKGILSDYAPDAVLFTPNGPLRGTDAIAAFFQAMVSEFGKPGTAFSMKHQSIEGDYAYVLWTAETADNVYELATDTLVVRNGKIVAQSFAGKITPKR
jgi:SnoaL-like domain